MQAHKFAAAGLLVVTLTPGASRAAIAATSPEHWPHRIEVGDTLIGLQQRLMRSDADWRVVQRLNRITNPRRLQPGATLRIPVALLREQALQGELLHTHGDVRLERSGQSPRAALGGDTLQAGDLLLTGEQSSATLRLADGTRLTLRPQTRFRIERHVQLGAPGRAPVDTRLRLEQGAADTQVPVPTNGVRPRVEIRTPVANLGVRGTEFRTRAEAERSVAEVLSGALALGSTAVAAGQGTFATPAGVAPPQPLLPAPALDGVPARVEQLPLQLAWSALPGAVAWRAQVLEPGSGKLLLDGRFTEPQASWVDNLPDGAYRLVVRAESASGLEGRDASVPFVLKARPEPPLRLRPRQDEQIAQERVTLAWTRSAQAERYRVQIADSASFAAPREEREIEGTELSLELPLGTHHWRIRSGRADGDFGPWSTPQRFQRIPPPPPPAAPPAQPALRDDRGLVLRWSQPAAQVGGYRLQVARDAAFNEILVDQTTQATEWLLPDPTPGVYHVRLQTLSRDGRAGPFGETQQVEVPRGFQWWWLLPLLLLL